MTATAPNGDQDPIPTTAAPCAVCGGAPESTRHIGIDPKGHRYEPDTAACNCDASGDPPTGHRPWCGTEPATAAKVLRNMREKHLQDNPDCPYGDQPHFVPPGFGMVGFYACQPPEDGRNHTRCRAPYDHEHEDHRADCGTGLEPTDE